MGRPISHSTREVQVVADQTVLPGFLTVPARSHGVVIFAHGSGSSRFSSRNRFVAEVLHNHGLATLLFDLLTADEHRVDEQTRHLRFDIDLLTRRLRGAVQWGAQQEGLVGLPIGLFGASTGAAAALRCAALEPDAVRAVVSRGGRPDLAGEALPEVQAVTLLIVGGRDLPVIDMNRKAAGRLACQHQIEIVPGASHLFEEPGTLDCAARLAADWFETYLTQV